jgi:hypothetical protein
MSPGLAAGGKPCARYALLAAPTSAPALKRSGSRARMSTMADAARFRPNGSLDPFGSAPTKVI